MAYDKQDVQPKFQTENLPVCCTSCSFRAKNGTAFVAHIGQKHRRSLLVNEEFRCIFPTCRTTCKQWSNMRWHLNRHMGLLSFRCHWPGCHDRFPDPSSRHRHKETCWRRTGPPPPQSQTPPPHAGSDWTNDRCVPGHAPHSAQGPVSVSETPTTAVAPKSYLPHTRSRKLLLPIPSVPQIPAGTGIRSASPPWLSSSYSHLSRPLEARPAPDIIAPPSQQGYYSRPQPLGFWPSAHPSSAPYAPHAWPSASTPPSFSGEASRYNPLPQLVHTDPHQLASLESLAFSSSFTPLSPSTWSSSSLSPGRSDASFDFASPSNNTINATDLMMPSHSYIGYSTHISTHVSPPFVSAPFTFQPAQDQYQKLASLNTFVDNGSMFPASSMFYSPSS